MPRPKPYFPYWLMNSSAFSLKLGVILASMLPLLATAQEPKSKGENPFEGVDVTLPDVITTLRTTKEEIPPMTGPREAVVTCLAVNTRTHEGSTHPVTVRVSPNPSGETSVGVLEEFSSGTGDQWKAAAWIAAFSASRATDSLINEHEFLLRTSGHIDGPSAGMLVTATMVALIRGDNILPEVAMTGTINPDGSVGPVGGIPHKLDAAAKAGIRRFGFPNGQRMALDEIASTKDEPVVVDLKERARSLGIEAVEIGNIFDAYRLMTGKTLPRMVPIAEEEMDISISLALRVRSASQALRDAAKQRLDGLRQKFDSLPEKTRAAQSAELAPLLSIIAASTAYEKEGSFSLGFYYAGIADQRSRFAVLQYEMGQYGIRGDLKGFEKIGNAQYDAAYKQLETLRTTLQANIDRVTVGGRVDAIHSFTNYWQGRAILDAGQTSFNIAVNLRKRRDELPAKDAKGKEINEQERLKLLNAYLSVSTQMTEQFAMAQSLGDSAANWASFAVEGGPGVSVPPDLYKNMGRAYSIAAAAGMKWFESMIVKQRIESSSASADSVNIALILEEPEYSPILSASQFAEGSAGSKSGEELQPLDQLASGLYAFHGLAGLINKHYNFNGAFSDTDPQNVRLSNRKALGHTLDLARERVLEESARVRAEIGFVPDSVKLNYDLANVLRDGSDGHKLGALKAYWKCHFLCDLARRLAKPGKP